MSFLDDDFEGAARQRFLDMQRGRTLTSFEYDVPMPPDKDDPDYSKELYVYNSARRIDEVCRVLTRLPAMQGMLAAEPVLNRIVIKLDDADKSSGTLANYGSDGTVTMNPKILARAVNQDIPYSAALLETVALGHEYRHGFQDVNELMELPEDFPPQYAGIYSVLLERVLEADGLVFTAALTADVAMDPDVVGAEAVNLRDIAQMSPMSSVLNAYYDSVEEDSDNHLNGRAASRAFMAMFGSDNHEYLDDYDMTMSRHISRENPVPIDSLDWNEFLADKKSWKAFKAHIAKLATMPREHDGKIIERKFYDAPLMLDLKTAISGLNAETLRDCGFKPSTFPSTVRPSPSLLWQ